MSPKYPSILYVSRVTEGTEMWFEAVESAEVIADGRDGETIGVYKLDRYAKAVDKPTIELKK